MVSLESGEHVQELESRKHLQIREVKFRSNVAYLDSDHYLIIMRRGQELVRWQDPI